MMGEETGAAEPFDIILVAPAFAGRPPMGLRVVVRSPGEIEPAVTRVERHLGLERARALRTGLERHFGLA